jgi:hypothetical protein
MKFLIFILFSILLKKIQSGGPVVSPSPRMLPSICDSFYSVDIRWNDVYYGEYFKTACFVSTALNYTGAKTVCEGNGMELLKVGSDSNTYNTVIRSIYTKLNGSAYEYLWVNGKQSDDGSWQSQPGNEPIYGGAIWVNPSPWIIFDQNCLQFQIVNGSQGPGFHPHGLGSQDCGANAPYYCEFYKF